MLRSFLIRPEDMGFELTKYAGQTGGMLAGWNKKLREVAVPGFRSRTVALSHSVVLGVLLVSVFR